MGFVTLLNRSKRGRLGEMGGETTLNWTVLGGVALGEGAGTDTHGTAPSRREEEGVLETLTSRIPKLTEKNDGAHKQRILQKE